MRVLHSAGHARKECGFIWNANDAATASKTFDVEGISPAIGAVAGQGMCGENHFESVRCSTPAALRIWVGGSVAAAAGRAKCCVRGQSRARHCQLANTKQTLAANEAVDAGLEAHGLISMGWEHHGNLKIFTPCGPNTELQLVKHRL